MVSVVLLGMPVILSAELPIPYSTLLSMVEGAPKYGRKLIISHSRTHGGRGRGGGGGQEPPPPFAFRMRSELKKTCIRT